MQTNTKIIMTLKGANSKRLSPGFTLIELVIVVAIIGLLSLIAYPSYVDYVTRANRAYATDKITEVMFEQERYQLRQRRYTATLRLLGYDSNSVFTTSSLYTITASTCVGATLLTDCVLVTATPTAGRYQAGRGEAALTLDSLGNKGGKWEDK